MAKSIKLEVITPSKRFYSGQVELVIVPTLYGDEGFMAKHSWACKLLKIGELWIQEENQKDFKVAAISGGYVDVKESIILYTDAAEWQNEIDIERAKAAKERAEEWLLQDEDHDPNDVARAQIAITKAIARMKTGSGTGRRGK